MIPVRKPAGPCPASEQQPLFHPYSTVEMVLHSFETIHPSLLMEQASAVNLMNAEFVMETYVKPVTQVLLIAEALLGIKKRFVVRWSRMEQMTNDASDGCLHTSTHTQIRMITLLSTYRHQQHSNVKRHVTRLARWS
jgi:hypothetical protein